MRKHVLAKDACTGVLWWHLIFATDLQLKILGKAKHCCDYETIKVVWAPFIQLFLLSFFRRWGMAYEVERTCKKGQLTLLSAGQGTRATGWHNRERVRAGAAREIGKEATCDLQEYREEIIRHLERIQQERWLLHHFTSAAWVCQHHQPSYWQVTLNSFISII